MLSVAESADILGVSPARVRKLVAEGSLPAQKVGRAWCLREEDVMQRLSEHRGAGRPRKTDGAIPDRPAGGVAPSHQLYLDCKRAFATRPNAQMLRDACDAEEAAFFMATADFFLQQRQRELVRQGVW